MKKLYKIFKIFGNPQRLICDAGTAFTSKQFQTFCTVRHIKLFINTVGMPRGNGQVERLNQTIISALSSLSSGVDSGGWEANLVKLQHGLNGTNHRITQTSPCEAFLGIPLKADNDMCVNETPVDVTQLRKQIAKKLEDNRLYQNEQFNKRRRPAPKYKIGDLVLTKIISHTNTGTSKKLLLKYRGPFRVKEIIGNDRYKVVEDRHLSRSRKSYTGIVCVEQMKLFKVRRDNEGE